MELQFTLLNSEVRKQNLLINTKIRVVVLMFLSVICLAGKMKAQTNPNIPNSDDFQLVFQDEFNGSSMDWTVWDSEDGVKTSASGEVVHRDKQNIVVEDGLMKILVKQESVNGSDWTAGFVWLREVYGANSYYEARISNTDATGVNNAFWMSAATNKAEGTKSYQNRYEIDCPENRLLNDGTIHAHYAWHDWKTYSTYGGAIAQGGSYNLPDDDYQVWGLWVGENGFKIYLNGVEKWDGTTDDNYPNQWETGVGKFPVWLDNEEQRAYGKYNQDDWKYFGGMNGDLLNVCFSTLPWSTSNSPLDSSAHNSYMGVDYIRVYKRKNDFITIPTQTVDVIQSDSTHLLTQLIDMGRDSIMYLSFLAKKEQIDEFSVELNADNGKVSTMTITTDNHIKLSSGAELASTHDSYPATIRSKKYFTEGKDYLVVCRITASAQEKDIISYITYPLKDGIPDSEPFLYRNIDANGNTNITTGWDLSHKIEQAADLTSITFRSKSRNSSFSNLKVASNFKAVVVDYQYYTSCSLASGSTMVNIGEVVDVLVDLKGTGPWDLSYAVNGQETTVTDITVSPYIFQDTINEQTNIEILSVSDVDGNGMAGHKFNIYIADGEISTLCDGTVRERQGDGLYSENLLEVKNASGWTRKAFISFDISALNNYVSVGEFKVFLNSSSSSEFSSVINVFGVKETEFACNQLDWVGASSINYLSAYMSANIDAGDLGSYLNIDIKDYLNTCIQDGDSIMVLCLDAEPGSDLFYFNASELSQNPAGLSYVLDSSTGLLNPIADSYVREGDKGDLNYGTEKELGVKESETDIYDRKGFLKFDVSRIAGKVAGAKIMLKVKREDPGAEQNLYLINDNSWTETGITGNNQPGASGFISKQTVPLVDEWIEFDVTSLVNDETNDTLSVRISDANAAEDYILYHSKEADNPNDWPKLVYIFGEPNAEETMATVADAYVRNGIAHADNNFGSDSKIIVKESADDIYDRAGFLRFDLSQITGDVFYAKVRLKVYSEDAGAIHNLSMVADDSWTETGLTWNNQPQNTSLITNQAVPATNEWIEFDVTTEVNNENDGFLSVLISDAYQAENYVLYHSKEATNVSDRPELVYKLDPFSAASNDTLALKNGFVEEIVTRNEKVLQDSSIKVYPNPASSDIYISGADIEGVEIEVYSLTGRIVKQKRINQQNQTSISVREIEAGIYILRMQRNGRILKNQKLVITK
ncbi:CBM96 family carbohydrate-binding protein [Marinilabilia rubra]|uniref:GH16 domain-containing protein n=1 Tax=Marinilabilia rubra TaxID=2162893 RepID=A0A2U2BB61_9BACT|nr:DNRLRE domain-containing protein [Marinilabilia rubra]PWE00312.1 hypothetical protein DDZ16_05065 [Marinilabilia rubra]